MSTAINAVVAPVIEFRNVVKTFTAPDGTAVNAVTDVSLQIRAGETVGLIGESGSGKTTVGKLMLGLMQPDAGVVSFQGRPLDDRSPAERRKLRAQLQVVFQEPYESLNPRRRIGPIVEEPLLVQQVGDRISRRKRVAEILDLVGLPKDVAGRYPGELSGGQQQRVGIARAIVGEPKVIVLDEPTASLDRTIRRQITDLLASLQRELDLGYLLITHDIASVRRIADRALVMFRGKLVEQGPTSAILQRPMHPYTKALVSAELKAVPGSAGERFRLNPRVAGASAGGGCPLAPICPLAVQHCRTAEPPLDPTDAPDHLSACFRWKELLHPAPRATEQPTSLATAGEQS